MRRLLLITSIASLSYHSPHSFCSAFHLGARPNTVAAAAPWNHRRTPPSRHTDRYPPSRLGSQSPTIQDSDWSQGLFPNLEPLEGDPTAFRVAILGDLHIDPRRMEDYQTAHEQLMPILNEAKEKHGNVALVSLGDLGESKNCDHNPILPTELFAGTTLCHEVAAEYLGSFGVPYEVIGGNHGTSCR